MQDGINVVIKRQFDLPRKNCSKFIENKFLRMIRVILWRIQPRVLVNHVCIYCCLFNY